MKPKTVVLAEVAMAESSLTMSPMKMNDPPSSAPAHPIPALKKRKAIANAQDARVDKKKVENHKKRAHKQATIMLGKERKKSKDGMIFQEVVAVVKTDYEWYPHPRTIHRYVDSGLIDTSPKKRGKVGKIAPFVYKMLCGAFKSMISKQLNGQDVDNGRRKMMGKVNACVGDEKSVSMSLLRILIVDMMSDKGETA